MMNFDEKTSLLSTKINTFIAVYCDFRLVLSFHFLFTSSRPMLVIEICKLATLSDLSHKADNFLLVFFAVVVEKSLK